MIIKILMICIGIAIGASVGVYLANSYNIVSVGDLWSRGLKLAYDQGDKLKSAIMKNETGETLMNFTHQLTDEFH